MWGDYLFHGAIWQLPLFSFPLFIIWTQASEAPRLTILCLDYGCDVTNKSFIWQFGEQFCNNIFRLFMELPFLSHPPSVSLRLSIPPYVFVHPYSTEDLEKMRGTGVQIFGSFMCYTSSFHFQKIFWLIWNGVDKGDQSHELEVHHRKLYTHKTFQRSTKIRNSILNQNILFL